jgi:nuclear pore complex protein Nup54
MFGATERKTGTLFGSTTAPAGGLFGQSQQQNAPAQQPNQGSTLFGSSQQNSGSTLFGASQQQQQQQQPQQSFNNSLFGGSINPAPSLPMLQAQQLQQSQHGLPQLRQSANVPLASTYMSGQSKFHDILH